MFKKIKDTYNKHKTLYNCLIIISIALLFSLYLFKSGIINGHDAEYHMSRIKGLRDSIKAGDFRALIHNGFYGYGYANGLFYGNLSLYIPAIISLCGVKLVESYKIFLLLSNIASAFTMYICMKRITKSNKVGIVASFLYSAASYRLTDIIMRAAVGEIGAFIFAPIIILGIYEIIYGDSKKWWIFTLGFVGLVECHLISAVLIGVSVLILIILNYKRFIKEKTRFLYLAISAVVGLLLAANFIFPLLEGLSKNQLYISKIHSPMDEYAVPVIKMFFEIQHSYDEGRFIPAGIGTIFLIMIFLRFLVKPKKGEALIKLCDCSLIIALTFLLCSTNIIPWKKITGLQFLQFPWRLYLVSTVFFTVYSSLIVYYFKEKSTEAKDTLVKIIIVFGMIPYISMAVLFMGLYDGNMHEEIILHTFNGYSVQGGEYLPVGTSIDKIIERGEVVTSNNDIEIKYKKDGLKVKVEYSNNNYEDTYIELPLLYYYGYTAVDNKGNEYSLKKGENNIIRVYLPNKKERVTIFYKGTKIQKITEIISMISIILLLLYIFRRKLFQKYKYNKKETTI